MIYNMFKKREGMKRNKNQCVKVLYHYEPINH